jgi:hypothetical protein
MMNAASAKKEHDEESTHSTKAQAYVPPTKGPGVSIYYYFSDAMRQLCPDKPTDGNIGCICIDFGSVAEIVCGKEKGSGLQFIIIDPCKDKLPGLQLFSFRRSVLTPPRKTDTTGEQAGEHRILLLTTKF